MEAEKQAKLAKELYKNTLNNKIAWSETSNENAVQTTIGKYAIQLERKTRGRDEDGDPVFEFIVKVIDKYGNIIDQFDDNFLRFKSDYYEMHEQYSDLWIMIKRKLSGADQALDEILGELDETDDEIPF